MKKIGNNYAFIDSQNVNLSIRYSALLKRFGRKKLDFMNDLKNLLEYKKKRPREDGTS